MKSRYAKWFIIFLSVISLFDCAVFTKYGQLGSQGEKAYKSGSYDSAVQFAVQSLIIKPDYVKSQILIQNAFTMSIKTHNKNIKVALEKEEKFYWDTVVQEYSEIHQLNESVAMLPVLRHPKTGKEIKLKIVSITDKLDIAKKNAAEVHYFEGKTLSINNANPDVAKQAAKQFTSAMSYVPDYKDSQKLYDENRKAGIKRIAVIPFENKSGISKFGAISESIADDVIAKVMSDESATEFLEIISRDEIDAILQEQEFALTGLVNEESAVELGQLLGVHEILTGKITQIIITPERTTDKTMEEKDKIVVSTKTVTNKDGKKKKEKVYKDVKAYIKVFKRTSSASIRGSYKVISVKTGKLIRTESFQGDAEFSHSWATYKGDVEALSYSSKKLVREEEKFAPVAGELVNEASKDLAGKLAAEVIRYAR
jgi:TolB-like protein